MSLRAGNGNAGERQRAVVPFDDTTAAVLVTNASVVFANGLKGNTKTQCDDVDGRESKSCPANVSIVGTLGIEDTGCTE